MFSSPTTIYFTLTSWITLTLTLALILILLGWGIRSRLEDRRRKPIPTISQSNIDHT